MKLIVGLGNPGKEYLNTRHNLGFMALDAFRAENAGLFSDFKDEDKFKAALSIGKMGKEKVILCKPLAFYNASGAVLLAVKQFYKIPLDDIIVVHDELDLPFGKMKISVDASAAGNNGVASIIQSLKSKNFIRLRIGASNNLKEKMEGADFVLGRFSKEEKGSLPILLNKLSSVLTDLVTTPSIEKVQSKHH